MEREKDNKEAPPVADREIRYCQTQFQAKGDQCKGTEKTILLC